MVGDGDICAPDIKLPLAQAQHPAQHAARVDTCHQYLVNRMRKVEKLVMRYNQIN